MSIYSGQSDDKKHQLHYREAGRPRPLDHPLDSDSDERLERRKLPTKGEGVHYSTAPCDCPPLLLGHKSGGTKQRGGGKHRATSSDTSDTDSGREGNKQQKRDSESLRQYVLLNTVFVLACKTPLFAYTHTILVGAAMGYGGVYVHY